jgi:hypothetical protein
MAQAQPVRNGPVGVQPQLLTSDSVRALEPAERRAFARNDRFERGTDPAEADPAVVQDRELHAQMKSIAAKRDASPQESPGMLPPASMFVPLPEAWTPAGVNSEG